VDTASAIDALLPQTQCTRCGYTGCLPYAEAIARGEADINQCPPGGTETIVALAKLTGRELAPLNRENGIESAPTVAFIDEERCIGCTKCLPPCPVDCIIMIPLLKSPLPSLVLPPAEDSRSRYEAHNERVARRAAERAATLAAKKRGARIGPGTGS